MPLLSKAQLDGYLKRIGITDADAQALEPTLGTLQHIHRAHASSIPFETLSMSYEPAVQQWQGVPTSLDDVYTKLVRLRRGGFCFEMNLLLCGALRALGYDAHLCRSLVVFPFVDSDDTLQQHDTTTGNSIDTTLLTGQTQPEQLQAGPTEAATVSFRDTYNHCVVLVKALSDGDYLADVGFGAGNGLVDPVRMPLSSGSGCMGSADADLEWLADDHACPRADDHACPRAAEEDDPWVSVYQHRIKPGVRGFKRLPDQDDRIQRTHMLGYYLQRWLQGGWRYCFFFGVEEILDGDMAVMSYHVSTHPESVFKGVVMASKPTAEGVIVLRGMILKEHAGTPSVQQRELSNEEERAALLAQVFGFDFSLRV